MCHDPLDDIGSPNDPSHWMGCQSPIIGMGDQPIRSGHGPVDPENASVLQNALAYTSISMRLGCAVAIVSLSAVGKWCQP